MIPRGTRLALCTALQRLPAAPGPRGRTQAPRHTPALGTRKTLSSHSGLARLHSVGTFLSVSVFKALNSCCVLAPLPFSPSPLKTRYAERAWVLFLLPETGWGPGRGRGRHAGGRHPGAAATAASSAAFCGAFLRLGFKPGNPHGGSSEMPLPGLSGRALSVAPSPECLKQGCSHFPAPSISFMKVII